MDEMFVVVKWGSEVSFGSTFYILAQTVKKFLLVVPSYPPKNGYSIMSVTFLVETQMLSSCLYGLSLVQAIHNRLRNLVVVIARVCSSSILLQVCMAASFLIMCLFCLLSLLRVADAV